MASMERKIHSPVVYFVHYSLIIEEDEDVRCRIKIHMAPVELKYRSRLELKRDIPLPRLMFILYL